MLAKRTQTGVPRGDFSGGHKRIPSQIFVPKPSEPPLGAINGLLGVDLTTAWLHTVVRVAKSGFRGAIVGLEPTHSRYAGEPIQLVHTAPKEH